MVKGKHVYLLNLPYQVMMAQFHMNIRIKTYPNNLYTDDDAILPVNEFCLLTVFLENELNID